MSETDSPPMTRANISRQCARDWGWMTSKTFSVGNSASVYPNVVNQARLTHVIRPSGVVVWIMS